MAKTKVNCHAQKQKKMNVPLTLVIRVTSKPSRGMLSMAAMSWFNTHTHTHTHQHRVKHSGLIAASSARHFSFNWCQLTKTSLSTGVILQGHFLSTGVDLQRQFSFNWRQLTKTFLFQLVSTHKHIFVSTGVNLQRHFSFNWC